jgi:hypothetical protein
MHVWRKYYLRPVYLSVLDLHAECTYTNSPHPDHVVNSYSSFISMHNPAFGNHNDYCNGLVLLLLPFVYYVVGHLDPLVGFWFSYYRFKVLGGGGGGGYICYAIFRHVRYR